MRQKRKTGLLSLASIFCVLAILLAACDISGNSNGSPNSMAAKQVLREASIGGDFDSLDPALTAGGLGEPINLLYIRATSMTSWQLRIRSRQTV